MSMFVTYVLRYVCLLFVSCRLYVVGGLPSLEVGVGRYVVYIHVHIFIYMYTLYV